jgi:hypothetical protein
MLLCYMLYTAPYCYDVDCGLSQYLHIISSTSAPSSSLTPFVLVHITKHLNWCAYLFVCVIVVIEVMSLGHRYYDTPLYRWVQLVNRRLRLTFELVYMCLYKVSQEERSLFWEVIVSVIQRKKFI